MDLKSMDSVGEAVTYKIREAITNKLIGLGVPFEKELPDYVMVMVANKKSRSQMQEDLFLFLGDGTTEFMDWFENIMKKFQSNSVKQLDDNFPHCSESKASNLPVSTKGRLEAVNSSKPFSTWQSESDVLTLEVPEQDADFLGEDYFSRSSIITRSSSSNNLDSTVPGTRCIKVIQPPSQKQVPTSKKQSLIAPENLFSLQQKGKIVPCSAVIPVKRPKSATEVDCETVEQPFGSVASVIRVTERKSGVPLALQANKLLLLKAVDAANKSVMAHQKPVKCSKSAYESSLVSDLQSEKDTRIAVLGEENESSSLITITRKTTGLGDSSYILAECGNERDKIMCPPGLNLAPSDAGVSNDALIHTFEFDEDESQITDVVDTGSEKLHEARPTKGETAKCNSKRSPRFVVTLDGIDPNTLRRIRKREVPMEVNSDETCYPRLIMNSDTKDFVPLDTEYSTDFAPSPEKKIKINEKCRYWPACKSGDLCNYHHPTTTCKAFPKCTYGDKCLFIHPNCKFDALCTRKDCPYTHASKRNIAIADVSPKKSSFTTVAPCKYFPNCSSKDCTFFHPRTCWYGSQCSLPSCPYSHTFPVRDQLKWCAP